MLAVAAGAVTWYALQDSDPTTQMVAAVAVAGVVYESTTKTKGPRTLSPLPYEPSWPSLPLGPAQKQYPLVPLEPAKPPPPTLSPLPFQPSWPSAPLQPMGCAEAQRYLEGIAGLDNGEQAVAFTNWYMGGNLETCIKTNPEAWATLYTVEQFNDLTKNQGVSGNDAWGIINSAVDGMGKTHSWTGDQINQAKCGMGTAVTYTHWTQQLSGADATQATEYFQDCYGSSTSPPTTYPLTPLGPAHNGGGSGAGDPIKDYTCAQAAQYSIHLAQTQGLDAAWKYEYAYAQAHPSSQGYLPCESDPVAFGKLASVWELAEKQDINDNGVDVNAAWQQTDYWENVAGYQNWNFNQQGQAEHAQAETYNLLGYASQLTGQDLEEYKSYMQG